MYCFFYPYRVDFNVPHRASYSHTASSRTFFSIWRLAKAFNIYGEIAECSIFSTGTKNQETTTDGQIKIYFRRNVFGPYTFISVVNVHRPKSCKFTSLKCNNVLMHWTKQTAHIQTVWRFSFYMHIAFPYYNLFNTHTFSHRNNAKYHKRTLKRQYSSNNLNLHLV